MKTVKVMLLVCLGFTYLGQMANGSEDFSAHHSQSLWLKNPKSDSWTATTILAVREHRADLEKARDLEKFCPGYREASAEKQEICWLKLIGGLAKYESNFKVADSFHDSSVNEGGDPEGTDYVGLLAIPTKVCSLAMTKELLRDPALNLRCGIQIFADAVAKDGFIAGPQEAAGAAYWWSPLKLRHVRKLGDREYQLGFQEKIIQLIDFKNIK